MTQTEVAKFLGIQRQIISQRLQDTNIKKLYIRKMIRLIMGMSREEVDKIMERLEKKESVEALTTAEVATLTGYSINTLKKYRVDGKGPPYSVGEGEKGRVTYLRDKVEEWMKTQKKDNPNLV